MKLLDYTRQKELEQFTVEHDATTHLELTEQAARALTEAYARHYGAERHVKVFAGQGGNGGNALAMARMLQGMGYQTDTYLFNIGNKLGDVCAAERELLKSTDGAKLTEITQQFEPPIISADDIVIDGLFGIGLNRQLAGGFAALVAFINNSPAHVVSIDIPSGLMCESNDNNSDRTIIRADLTLCVGSLKLAFLFAENQKYLGKVETVPLPVSQEGLEQTSTPYTLDEPHMFPPMLMPRPPFGHKGTFGHALLIAGRHGMAGASVLAARAALRSGVGLLTVHCPQRNNNIVQACVPEAIASLDADESRFATPVSTEGISAMAIGPGLGCDEATANAVAAQLKSCRVPLVADADALNIISRRRELLQSLPQFSILTPHPGEMARLLGHGGTSFDLLQGARDMARRHRLFVVLKGHRTAICRPDGSASFNPSGNSGMATGGSGDVLTGIIVSLLAQGYAPETACRLGVYLHGLAGDLAAQELGEHSLTAGDIVDFLPKAFKLIYSKNE